MKLNNQKPCYKKTLRPEIIQNSQSPWACSLLNITKQNWIEFNGLAFNWIELGIKRWNKITQDHGETLRSEIIQFENVLKHVLFEIW